jgi:4-diphosphocytidyl-2-C-methyl-D-erythritol kinase
MEIVENAHAKLNLGLKILGRRDDGFHDILSLFQTIDLHDQLIFEPVGNGEIFLSCDDPDMRVGPENLIYRAVSAFQKFTGITQGVRIALKKRIPMEAGLGGGSSDAAAVLRVLNRMWEVGLSTAELCALGAQLGSDVPFFMQKGTAIVTGRGEQLRYVPWTKDVFYVLIYPSFKVSTGWAFANFKKTLTGFGDYAKFLNSVDFSDLSVPNLSRHIENDFLPLVLETYPETRSVLTRLADAGALVSSMSGSGSTLYGLFDSKAAAEATRAQFHAEHFRVFLCCPTV